MISGPTLKDTVSGSVKSLQIPRRPRWNDTTNAEELHRAEKDAFLAWRRDVALQEMKHGAGVTGTSSTGAVEAHVTPFEKNIEVWKQLWRVVERSDVLVQIVDGRNPLMYRSPDLEAYVKEVNKEKRTLLLVNKADFLTPQQRMAWARYFTREGVDFIFFSAKREQQRLEEMDRLQRGGVLGHLGQVNEDEHEEDDEGDIDDGSEAGDDVGDLPQHDGGSVDDDASLPSMPTSHVSSRSLATTLARRQREAQRKRDAKLAAAMARAALMGDGDDSDNSDEEDGVDKPRVVDAGQSAEQHNDNAEQESSSSPSPAPAPVAGPASSSSSTSASTKPKKQSSSGSSVAGSTTTASQQQQQQQQLHSPQSAIDALIHDDGNAGLDPSDPLFASCRVISREQLLDFMAERYESLPRTALGTADDAGRKRRAEQIARKREEARAARKEELRKRREQIQRMIEVGLGAHVRFGDEADARALDADDEADVDLDDVEDQDNEEQTPLMVGMVGYPNVGKSSTINALLGATAMNHQSKRVAVASTPGKTKHFQTLQLNDEITLCDCPGLVFPSFVSTREEMVVNGVLPIDQLRDHTSPMRLLCQRIPRSVFELHYGIKLPVPGPGENPKRQPSVAELLDTYCTARGFMASGHAGPDQPRGARILLKDYCEGRLVYCHPPPTGWSLPAGAAPLPVATSAKTIAAASKAGAAGASSSSSRVSFEDNVLLPSVVKKTAAAAPAVRPAAAAVPQSATAASAEVAAASPDAAAPPAVAGYADYDTASEEEDDEDEEEEAGDAGDDDDDIDEADLLAFSRVIKVAPKQPAAAAAASSGGPAATSRRVVAVSNAAGGSSAGPVDEEEEDDYDEDEEEGATVSGSIATGSQQPQDEASKAARRSRRQPRQRGLGRFGKATKGEREADPYGTEAVADAAMRRYVASEVAAANAGPAGTGELDAAVAAGVIASGQGVSVSGTVKSAQASGPPTKQVRKTNSGATVMDAVPHMLRGQEVQPKVISIPAGLLKKKLHMGAME